MAPPVLTLAPATVIGVDLDDRRRGHPATARVLIEVAGASASWVAELHQAVRMIPRSPSPVSVPSPSTVTFAPNQYTRSVRRPRHGSGCVRPGHGSSSSAGHSAHADAALGRDGGAERVARTVAAVLTSSGDAAD